MAGFPCCHRRGTTAFVFVLASFFLSAIDAGANPPIQPASDGNPDCRSAESFLDASMELASQGDWEGASEFLVEGRSVDSGNSDICYFSALAAIQVSNDAHEALAEIEEALAAGRFSVFSADDALLLRAELLIRERAYQDALASLAGITRSAPLSPERLLAGIKAYWGLGLRKEAIAELETSGRLYPSDPRFARFFFERVEEKPQAPERRIADLFLGRLDSLAEADFGLLPLASGFIVDPESRRDRLLAYRARGGRDALGSLRALQYGLIGEEKAVAELLQGSRSLSLSILEALPSLIGTAAGRAEFYAALSAFTGILETDRDRDGYAEEWVSYRLGSPISYRQDADQDGRVECIVDFSDGLPVKMTHRLDEDEFDVSYFRYPHVASMAFVVRPDRPSSHQERVGESKTVDCVEYRFAPEAFIYSPLLFEPFPDANDDLLYIPSASLLPDPTERGAAGAALLLIKDGVRDEKITVKLDKGIPLEAERRRGGKLVSFMTFDGGFPILERIDANGDGRFETERGREEPSLYRDRLEAVRLLGSPADEASVIWSRIDADGDGLFEYREEYRPPFRKEWDFDANGSVDAIQYLSGDGDVVREFSSRLDGNFDEVLLIGSDGRIKSLSLRGETATLVPDANPRLRWIGQKPFDLGGDLPALEGIHHRMGLRYRLVYAGEEVFAEMLP